MKENWSDGPWFMHTSGPKYCVNQLGTNRHVAMVSCYQQEPGDEQENTANAHLIAAAPELWDALAALVEHDEYLIECEVLHSFVELERAKAILKKARGDE